MQMIPADIWEQYAAVLKKREVPVSRQADYRKWLRYYIDFRSKYPLPDSRSEQVRLFIQKLREKRQTSEQQQQAAHALSLFFESQPWKMPESGKRESEGSAMPHSPNPLSVSPLKEEKGESLPLEERNSDSSFASREGEKEMDGSAGGKEEGTGQRSGRRFNEWRCLKKSESPAWDKSIDNLAAEIKMRHYSRKTLKTYADWSRKFQSYLQNKSPAALTAADVKAYLTYLAVNGKVAASTQNQAFNALLFLYRHILKKDFGIHKDIPRAKKSSYKVVHNRIDIKQKSSHAVIPASPCGDRFQICPHRGRRESGFINTISPIEAFGDDRFILPMLLLLWTD